MQDLVHNVNFFPFDVGWNLLKDELEKKSWYNAGHSQICFSFCVWLICFGTWVNIGHLSNLKFRITNTNEKKLLEMKIIYIYIYFKE